MIQRLFSKMPRNKARKTNRKNFSADMMKKAVEDVVENHKSVRSSAKLNGVDRMTLTRYLRDFKDEDDSHTTMTFKKLFVTTQVNLGLLLYIFLNKGFVAATKIVGSIFAKQFLFLGLYARRRRTANTIHSKVL